MRWVLPAVLLLMAPRLCSGNDAIQVDPTGPETGHGRVMRGGHFYGAARGVKSAVRSYNGPDGLYSMLGARLVTIQPHATAVTPESWGEIKGGAR